jgi:Ca-activated chloride channel homolog
MSPRPPAKHRLLSTLAMIAGIVVAGLTGIAGGAFGDPATAEDAADDVSVSGFSDQISVAWVLVPVVVRSKSGYVEGLARDDFRVWVDGRQVAIESFDSGADARVSLIFLQDLSGSMATGGKLEAGRAALRGLVAAERPGDELALVSFAGGRLAVDVPFTGDRDVFAEAMADWTGYGTTAIHDAVAWIPEISDEGRQPKRAVVLVTDGVDNASELAPEVARQAVENARLPVYVFGLGDHGDPLRPEAGGGVDTYAQVLGRLATASGGRYFPISDPADVGDAVATLLQDLRAQYVLGFPAATDQERRYRRLRVAAEGRGRETVFRIGYTGGAPVAWASAGSG